MDTGHLHDDIELFKRTAAGDEDAFRILVYRHTDLLMPSLIQLLRSESDAWEVIQETFIKCWVQRETLLGVEFPAAWLHRVASNIALQALRKQGRRRLLQLNIPVEAVDNQVEEQIDARFTRAMIDQAVEMLPERRRQVFQMARFDGCSRREIAEKLDISENTVRNHLAEAIAFVQHYLQNNAGLYLPAFLILLRKH